MINSSCFYCCRHLSLAVLLLDYLVCCSMIYDGEPKASDSSQNAKSPNLIPMMHFAPTCLAMHNPFHPFPNPPNHTCLPSPPKQVTPHNVSRPSQLYLPIPHSPSSTPTNQSLNLRNQLSNPERLCHTIIHSRFNSQLPLLLSRIRRHSYNGYMSS
jgi:hypothetical protein